jgi:hypothetical protein
MKPLLEEAVASLPTYTADIHEQFSVVGKLDTADW